MISPKLAASALLVLAIGSASAAIDLTPALKDYTREGFVYRQVTFKADKGSVTYNPPQGWAITGTTGRAQLNPPEKNFVEASIQATPLIAPQAMDEPGLKLLEQKVLAEVPPGSQSVAVVKRELNPVFIARNPSFEFVLSYQALGLTFLRSVIFVLTPDTQLIFKFSAPKPDFDTFNASFRRSIMSWQLAEAQTAAAAPAHSPN